MTKSKLQTYLNNAELGDDLSVVYDAFEQANVTTDELSHQCDIFENSDALNDTDEDSIANVQTNAYDAFKIEGQRIVDAM